MDNSTLDEIDALMELSVDLQERFLFAEPKLDAYSLDIFSKLALLETWYGGVGFDRGEREYEQHITKLIDSSFDFLSECESRLFNHRNLKRYH